MFSNRAEGQGAVPGMGNALYGFGGHREGALSLLASSTPLLRIMIAFVICPLMLLAPVLYAADPHCFTHPLRPALLNPYRL